MVQNWGTDYFDIAVLRPFGPYYKANNRGFMRSLIEFLPVLAAILILFVPTAWVAAWLALVIHELGHLVAAVALKQPIKHVRLGCGTHRFPSKKVFGTCVSFRCYPFTGFVRLPTPTCKSTARLSAVAGPLASALGAALCIWHVQSRYGSISKFLAALAAELSTVTLQALCLIFVFLLTFLFTASAVLNLLPIRFGKFALDGYQLINPRIR